MRDWKLGPCATCLLPKPLGLSRCDRKRQYFSARRTIKSFKQAHSINKTTLPYKNKNLYPIQKSLWMAVLLKNKIDFLFKSFTYAPELSCNSFFFSQSVASDN